MNLYGWSKHLFDLARRRARRTQGEAAAAMGRAEVLQRVRPERVPQGRDDEPRRQAFRRRQGRQADPPVQVASRRHRRRRAEARFHLRRRCGRGGALAAGDAGGVGHLQCRHRQGAQLPGPDRRDVRGARPHAQHRICRHAGCDPRQLPVFHRKPRSTNLRRAGYNAGFTPLEDAVQPLRRPSFSIAHDRYR